MQYDDFEINKRLFSDAFRMLPEAKTANDKNKERIWAIVKFYTGVSGEWELKEQYPTEAEEFLSLVQNDINTMIHPALTQSFTFEPDLLADRKTLNEQIDAAKNQLDIFCKEILIKRETLGKITSIKNNTRLDDFIEYPSKTKRNKTQYYTPLDEWRSCTLVWWLHHIHDHSVRDITNKYGAKILDKFHEDVYAQKKISDLLKESERLIASAQNETFPA